MKLEEITRANLQEIEERLSAIAEESNSPEANLDELLEETRALKERKENLKKSEELRSMVKDGHGTVIATMPKEEKEKRFTIESGEYRSAFLNNLRKKNLTEVEQRALSTGLSSAGYAVPTQTINKIIEKVREQAPLLSEIELLSIPGYVTIPAEGTTTDAKLHTEGAAIKGDTETLNQVKLGMYEVTKLVTISKSVELMSIDAFENWLTSMIARKVAEKITGYILTGTGSSEPQGVDAISWTGTNSVEVKSATLPTEADLDKLVGLLNGGYDSGAIWVMSKKTFFGDIRQIQNKAKNDVVVKEGNTWYVEGYPVQFDDRMKEHEAILGNFRMGYIGNLPENATITSQFVVRENSYDFLGTAMFDGKVQATEAFVKLKKGA